MLPVGPTEERARVLNRKRDSDGNPIGVAHCNPVLDTQVYEVQFPDGRTEEVAANVIAQALYSQCDPDGNEFVLLDSIVDWRKDDSTVKLKDQARIVDDKKVIKSSTKGWELCCEWRDGSTSWQSLKDLKESHQLQVAEFAYMAGIAGEPAFNWWVGWVIKKRDRIISLVKRRVLGISRGTTNLGLNYPRLWKKPSRLIVVLIPLFGAMLSRRKCRMYVLLLISWRMARYHLRSISLYVVTWSLM
jgi:hypothetical protein